MGWIEQGPPGQYRLGPNLLPEFQGISTIPTPTDVRDAANKPLFWKVERGLSEVESIVPLAVCEFERDLSAPRWNFPRRVLCTCIAMSGPAVW